MPKQQKDGRKRKNIWDEVERVEGVVWCDKLGEVHDDTLNPYEYDDEDDKCKPEDHQAVYKPRERR